VIVDETMIDDKSLATKQTAAALVEAYIKAMRIVKESYEQLTEAHHILENAFGNQSYMSVVETKYNDNPMYTYEKIERELRRSAWRRILAISQINKMLSIKRAEEMAERLERGDLPDITLDEVLSMMHSVVDNADDFVKEAAAEVFDVLRPARDDRYGNKYVTNQKNGKYDLGEKVILSGYVERWSYQGNWHINHYRQKNLIAVDRVFHALDGNLSGMDVSYQGPLCDAIGMTKTGQGETEYFRFACFKNNNLHLWFKRMDLVAKLNAINGDPSVLKG